MRRFISPYMAPIHSTVCVHTQTRFVPRQNNTQGIRKWSPSAIRGLLNTPTLSRKLSEGELGMLHGTWLGLACVEKVEVKHMFMNLSANFFPTVMTLV